MDAIKTIKTALTHATFKDADIGTATDKLLTKLGDELGAVGYDAGTDVEDAITGVEDAITAFEEEEEGGDAGKQQAAGSDDDDDPFAGLGDEVETEDTKS
jgi:hypothetical protein